jgi:hypothetical protein
MHYPHKLQCNKHLSSSYIFSYNSFEVDCITVKVHPLAFCFILFGTFLFCSYSFLKGSCLNSTKTIWYSCIERMLKFGYLTICRPFASGSCIQLACWVMQKRNNVLNKSLHCHHISYLGIMILSDMQYCLQLYNYKDQNDVGYRKVCFLSYICGTQ